MDKAIFQARNRDGKVLARGDEVTTFRGEVYRFAGCWHARKICVIREAVPGSPHSWEHHEGVHEYYASVIDVQVEMVDKDGTVLRVTFPFETRAGA